MRRDFVTLVDEQDELIGTMDKIEAHRGKGKLHRAISVFLFNKKGEVLLQQRSTKKIVGALQWANTCCGNVWPGETYEECAHRRLTAELGIEGVALSKATKFRYQVKCNEEFSENEIDTIFIGTYEKKVKPNVDEVCAYKWEDWNDFLKYLNEGNETYAPWLGLMKKEGVLDAIREKSKTTFNRDTI